MDPIFDNAGGIRAVRRFLGYAEHTLPADLFAKLEDLADSPNATDQICRTAELLYANRELLDDEGRLLVARLASFAATNAWHEMGVQNRGGRIAQAMMRDSGAEPAPGQAAAPEPADDPAPLAIYEPVAIAQPVVPEPTPPATDPVEPDSAPAPADDGLPN